MRSTRLPQTTRRVDTARVVPAQDGGRWDGTHEGRVVNYRAWAAAGHR